LKNLTDEERKLIQDQQLPRPRKGEKSCTEPKCTDVEVTINFALLEVKSINITIALIS
jgi:hypothetical protein